MNSPQGIPGEKVEELLDRLFYQENQAGGLPPQLPAAGPLCADEESWRRVAAGEMRDDAAQILIEHATECRRCGGILHFWTGILARDQTAEEAAALSKLASAKPGWQERIAKQLAEPRPSSSSSRHQLEAHYLLQPLHQLKILQVSTFVEYLEQLFCLQFA